MGSFGENLRRERDVRGVSLREIAEGTLRPLVRAAAAGVLDRG